MSEWNCRGVAVHACAFVRACCHIPCAYEAGRDAQNQGQHEGDTGQDQGRAEIRQHGPGKCPDQRDAQGQPAAVHPEHEAHDRVNAHILHIHRILESNLPGHSNTASVHRPLYRFGHRMVQMVYPNNPTVHPVLQEATWR